MLCGAQKSQLFTHLMKTMTLVTHPDDNDDAAVAEMIAMIEMMIIPMTAMLNSEKLYNKYIHFFHFAALCLFCICRVVYQCDLRNKTFLTSMATHIEYRKLAYATYLTQHFKPKFESSSIT